MGDPVAQGRPADRPYWEASVPEWSPAQLALRRSFRLELIGRFLEEPPGDAEVVGVRRCTVQRPPFELRVQPAASVYPQAVLGDGSHIELRRPAPANWGVDFVVVQVSNALGPTTPSHGDLVSDVRLKLDARPDVTPQLYQVIDEVYRGGNASDVLPGGRFAAQR